MLTAHTRRFLVHTLAVAIICCAAGCVPGQKKYVEGMQQYHGEDYRAAQRSFEAARIWHAKNNNMRKAAKARNAELMARRTVAEFPHDRSDARERLQKKVPDITESEITTWLDDRAQRIQSGEQTLYFEEVAKNYLFAHPTLLREKTEKKGLTFNFVSRFAVPQKDQGENAGRAASVRYEGQEQMRIPAKDLPESGVLKIWYPLPVQTASQEGIRVSNLSYEQFVVKGPVTEGKIGYVYYEIPVEQVGDDLVITADIAFTSHEQRCDVDPSKVMEYDRNDPVYKLYTRSERNIEITDAVRNTARKVVGDETNPHLQAQRIYNYMIETYYYSHVPHLYLDTRNPKIAESTYMLQTGHGDCGTQSMLFCAFCRSLGIPARAIGGYQMFMEKTAGAHFWAQYFVPGYGWIPVDPTAAESGDWFPAASDKRKEFKRYYGSNLDPARLVIQKNVDVPLDPPIPPDPPVFRVVRQCPAVVCSTATKDIDLIAESNFSIELEKMDGER